jgi:hypothetical protein
MCYLADSAKHSVLFCAYLHLQLYTSLMHWANMHWASISPAFSKCL